MSEVQRIHGMYIQLQNLVVDQMKSTNKKYETELNLALCAKRAWAVSRKKSRDIIWVKGSRAVKAGGSWSSK